MQITAVAATLAPLLFFSASATAQTAPTIDTEDASLEELNVSGGRGGGFHPTLALDLRNGDFARGGYDDDDGLDRVPLHVQIAFARELVRRPSGTSRLWLVGASSNGFQSPAAEERTAPRSWYESNNLIALFAEPVGGLRAGLAYAVKTSPNGASETTHEASATLAFTAERGPGVLRPRLVATWRPKGGGGLFTQVGLGPEFDLSRSESAPTVDFPVRLGVGWAGFYERGTGDVVFASAGAAYSHPFELGDARWSFRAELLAVFRDDTLRRLGRPEATRAAVVPLGTISLTLSL